MTVEVFSPPDPDHSLVEATTTGERRESRIRDLERAVEEKWEFRGRPDTHPYLSFLRPNGDYVVSDCRSPSRDRGAYSTVDGQRLDGLIPPIDEGQRDFAAIVMTLDSGIWKVSQLGLDFKVDCAFEPDDDALLVP